MAQGRPKLGKGKSRVLSVTLPPAMHEALARESAKRGVPMAEIVRQALSDTLPHAPEPRGNKTRG